MSTARADGVFSPSLLALYVMSALAGVASGVFNPLISALMARRGASEVLIGANSTVFFLCIMLAAPFARGRSLRSVLSIGLALNSIAAIQFPFYDNPIAWFVLRAAMGLGVGLYMIASQTALNDCADERRRASIGALYALAFGAGLGLGPMLGAVLYAWRPQAAFAMGAMFLASALPLVWPRLSTSPLRSDRLRFDLLARIRLPLFAVLAYGVAEATLMSLYPVYAAAHGHDVMAMSLGFSAFVAGGIVGTLPIAYLSDRYGREILLLLCSATGVAAMAAMIAVEGRFATAIASFFVGASLGPVFTIALALVGQRLPRESLSSGSALFTAAFGLGSMIGPLSASVLMHYFGLSHLFTLSLLLFGGIAARLAFASIESKAIRI